MPVVVQPSLRYSRILIPAYIQSGSTFVGYIVQLGPAIGPITGPLLSSCESDTYYKFKEEQQADLGYISVSQVAVCYVNLAKVDLTVTLNGVGSNTESQTLTLGDSLAPRGYYGSNMANPQADGDGKTYIAMYSFHPLTDAYFQVVLSTKVLAGYHGPYKISQVTVFGEGKEESR